MSLSHIDVLVVDDHRLTRNLVADILRTLHCRVRLASDGAEGFDEIVRSPPHLVIADLEMPVDGLSLLRSIRKGAKSPDPALPVIAMTSLSDRGSVLALRDGGAHEVISKPFTCQTVFSRIAAVIDSQREFIKAGRYVGPCRRRMRDKAYAGPMRRRNDRPVETVDL